MGVPKLNPVSKPHLPTSISSVLTGSDHPDIPWTPPATLPPHHDVLTALRTLEARMRPASDHVLAACFAHLVTIFEPGAKLGEAARTSRLAAWKQAVGDLPDDFLQTATEAACQSLKWMPKPVELRELVADRLLKRTTAIARLRKLLEAKPSPAQQFIGRFQRKPEAMLETHRMLSTERVRRYGALPADGATWWGQIQAIALEKGIQTAWEDWAAPKRAGV